MKRFFIIAITSLVNIFASHAEGQSYIYNQISQKDGLLSIINCIYKEPDKSIWIGTQKGLYSFDGYRLKRYKDDITGKPEVFRIFSDADGTLWALTGNGPAIYDKVTDKFVKATEDKGIKGPIFSYCLSGKGIFLGSIGKIFFYDYDSRKFGILSSFPEKGFGVKDLHLLDERTLLCTGLDGARTVDIPTGEISDAHFRCPKEIFTSMIDRDGRIWISAYNAGIMVFDRNGRKVMSYNTSNSDLSNDVVLCMVQRDSLIWAGTDGGGN